LQQSIPVPVPAVELQRRYSLAYPVAYCICLTQTLQIAVGSADTGS